MKKLFSFLVALCIASVASAGWVNWQIDGVSKDGSFVNGGIAYLFAGSDTSAVADAIKDGTFDYGAALASESTDEDGYLYVSRIGNYQNTTVSVYSVVFDTATVTDDSNFIISPVTSLEFGTSGNKTANFTASSFSSATWTPVKESDPGPGPDDPTIVPEPTTVALLALGLAAFGLKRKIA